MLLNPFSTHRAAPPEFAREQQQLGHRVLTCLMQTRNQGEDRNAIMCLTLIRHTGETTLERTTAAYRMAKAGSQRRTQPLAACSYKRRCRWVGLISKRWSYGVVLLHSSPQHLQLHGMSGLSWWPRGSAQGSRGVRAVPGRWVARWRAAVTGAGGGSFFGPC